MKKAPVYTIRYIWNQILCHICEQYDAIDNVKKRKEERAIEKSKVRGSQSADSSEDYLLEINRACITTISDIEEIADFIHPEEGVIYSSQYGIKEIYIIERSFIQDTIYNIHLYCVLKAKEIGDDELLNLLKEATRGKTPLSKKSAWQEHIYSPLTINRSPIDKRSPSDKKKNNCLKHISKDLLVFLCRLWGALSKAQLKDVNQEVDYFIDKINELCHDDSPSLTTETVATDYFPIQFKGRHFACYERIDPKEGDMFSSWGIAVSHVYIGNTKDNHGSFEITLRTSYKEGLVESKGTILYDEETKYLIVQMRRVLSDDQTIPKSFSFFTMCVNDPPSQTLLLGHHNFYSRKLNKYISKTVIWIMRESSVKYEEVFDSDSKFSLIDISIRRFLHSRLYNRLTLPSRPINGLHKNKNFKNSLEYWLSDYVEEIISDKKMLGTVGSYYVCYYIGTEDLTVPEKDIRIDEMTISYDEHAAAFYCAYEHLLNYSQGKLHQIAHGNIYSGHASRKDKVVQIVVNSGTDPSALRAVPNKGNHILLSFQLPEFREEYDYPYGSKPYFEGIVSGLSDSESKPLCFKSLVVLKQYSEKGELLNPIGFGSQPWNSISQNIYNYFIKNIDNLKFELT